MSSDQSAAAPPSRRGRRSRRRSGASSREFAQSRLALFGLVVFACIVLVAVLAPCIAPQNPYDLAQLDIMDGRLEPGRRRRRLHLLARHRRPGPGHAVRHHVWPAHLARVGAGSAIIACLVGASLGLLAAYAGGRDRQRDHAAGRPAAFLPGDPGGADDPRLPRQGHLQRGARAGDRGMGLLRPHRARLGAGRAPAGIHRGGAMPGAADLAHHLPPPAAELPAAADRRRAPCRSPAPSRWKRP